MISTIIKQPGETLRQPVAFATTAAIAAVIDVAVATRGLVPGASPLGATAVIAGGAVTAALSGGSDGERYAVTIRARDAAGAELESEIEAVVIETSWATPDGGPAYLSIGDFVRRFGLPDVVAMTDIDNSGRIDRDLLVEALTDAQAIAESCVAGRYALPLASVPRVVAMAIADLARARLYPRGAPEGVATAATAATKLLESVAAGKMTLGLPAIETPAAPPSAAPVVIAPGRRRYPDGLADY